MIPEFRVCDGYRGMREPNGLIDTTAHVNVLTDVGIPMHDPCRQVNLIVRFILQLIALAIGLDLAWSAGTEEFPLTGLLRRNAVVVEGPSISGGGTRIRDERSDAVSPRRQELLFAATPELLEGQSGKAVVALKYPEKETIEFEIASPEGLRIRPTVKIPAGQTRVVFRFKAKDNNRIDFRRNLKISLHIGFTYFATLEVVVHDDEDPPKMSVKCPSVFYEGIRKLEIVKGRLLLDRPAAVDIKVDLRSSPFGKIQVGNITVPAGSTSVFFDMEVLRNAYLTGDMDVVLKAVATRGADTIEPWQRTVRLVDDEKFELSLGLGKEVVEGGGDFELVRIDGWWKEDVPVRLSCDHPEWLEVPETVTVFKDDLQASFWVRVLDASAAEESRTVTITAAAPGFKSSSAPLRIRETKKAGLIRKFDEGAKDLVWDPARNLIYASVASHQYVLSDNQKPYVSAVIALDPVTLEVKSELSLFDPGQLELSADGECLYVNSGRRRIERIRTSDFVVDHTYPVAVGSYPALSWIQDFCLVESRPGTIVTALWGYKDNAGQKFGGYEVSDETGTVVMASPIPVPAWVPFLVEPTKDPDVVYGIMPDWITRFRIGEGALTEVDHVTMGYQYQEATGSYAPNWDDVRFDGQGELYFQFNGMLLDGDTLQFAGSYEHSYTSSCLDVKSNRVFGVDGRVIRSFDRASFTGVRRLELPSEIMPSGKYPEPSLIRWGRDGLAFATSDRVVLVNNSWLVPGDPPTDLRLEWHATPSPVVVGESVECSMVVHNQGSSMAENAEVHVKFSGKAEVSSTSSPMGSTVIGANSIQADLGNLPPGSSASVKVVLSSKIPGVIQTFAGVISDAAEQDWSNNGAEEEIPVRFDPSKEVNDLQIPCADIIGDPQGDKIWLAITADSDWQNMILEMDPADGSIFRRIALPWEPGEGTLSISNDSRYLFVAAALSGEICRIDLSKGDDGREIFTAGAFSRISDLVVVDPAAPVYVVAGTANGNRVEAVCDGNVMRPKVLYYYPEFIRLMALSPGRNSVYMVESGGYEITLSDAGLTSTRLWNNYVSDLGGLELVGQQLINGSGEVFDMWTGGLVTKLGFQGVPVFHAPSGKMLLLGSGELAAFEPDGWKAAGKFPWKVLGASPFVGWGNNGLACRLNGYLIRFIRIPGLTPTAAPVPSMATSTSQSPADQDGDGTPDVMEEIFGNSASHADANPVRGEILSVAGRRIVRLRFVRKEGVLPSRYEYQVSVDMKRWMVPGDVKEVVTSRFNKSGVNMEEIQADVLMPDGTAGFVRLVSP